MLNLSLARLMIVCACLAANVVEPALAQGPSGGPKATPYRVLIVKTENKPVGFATIGREEGSDRILLLIGDREATPAVLAASFVAIPRFAAHEGPRLEVRIPLRNLPRPGKAEALALQKVISSLDAAPTQRIAGHGERKAVKVSLTAEGHLP